MLESVISGLIAGAATGFISGAICGWLSGWQYSHKLIEFERKLNQLWGSFSSQSGVEARAANKLEEAQVMAEAIQIFQSKDIDKMEKLAALAQAHPDIAMKLLKKFGLK